MQWSLIIILVSGLFVGMVLGLQGYDTLQRYGSEEAVGTLVALSLVRELGPVVAALLFASRAGSAMTAEIGLMKATTIAVPGHGEPVDRAFVFEQRGRIAAQAAEMHEPPRPTLPLA